MLHLLIYSKFSRKEKPEIPDKRVDKLVQKKREENIKKNATAGTARLTQNALHGLTYCPGRQFEYFTMRCCSDKS